MAHELNIEYNKKCNFFRVTCPEGDYITDYTTDKDIKDFISSQEMYVPGSYTSEQIQEMYHCITEEEKIELEKQRDEAIEEDRKAR